MRNPFAPVSAPSESFAAKPDAFPKTTNVLPDAWPLTLGGECRDDHIVKPIAIYIPRTRRRRSEVAGREIGSILMRRLHRLQSTRFKTVPEAPRKLAGGEASPRAGTTGYFEESEPAPAGAMELPGARVAPSSLRDAFAFYAGFRWFQLADSLYHRQISTAPPAHSAG